MERGGGVAGFELLVDEQVFAQGPLVGVVIVELELARPTSPNRLVKEAAGYEVVDQFRDGGVLANDDKAWRNLNALFLP